MQNKKNTGDNMIYNVAASEVRPKIYAILLSNREQDYLGISVAFSLEDAIAHVKHESSMTARMDITTAKTNLWAILPMDELKKRVFKTEYLIPKEKASDARTDGELTFINKIMQKIIDNNDSVLYEKVKENLNKNEVKYLENKLNYGNSKKPKSKDV